VRVAFLFPGQGAKGTLEALGSAAENPRGRALVDRAASAAGISIARLFERGGRELERTEVLQPVLTAITLFVSAELQAAGVRPRVVAGHSLGELAAASAAGWLAPEDAVSIAALRGRLMAREALSRPGGLLALKSGAEDVVRGALELGGASGAIAIGAMNAPDEVVLTGDMAALRAVAAAFPSTRVPVSGAWHSEAMAGAVEELREALRRGIRSDARTGDSEIGFVCNRDGSFVTRGEAVADLLAEQIALPVLWSRVLATALSPSAGVTDVVTVGPGAVLRSFLYLYLYTQKHFEVARDGAPAPPRVHTTDDGRALARTLETLASVAQ
jgi:[acyl-carrier-protein] S-malonyltransferase